MSSSGPSSSEGTPIVTPIPHTKREQRTTDLSTFPPAGPEPTGTSTGTFVPERSTATPGTTFLPGKFMFWVHNDEKVKEAEDNFSSTQFFREHTDGTPFIRFPHCLPSLPPTERHWLALKRISNEM